MGSVVTVKMRKVGNSLGFILPAKAVREERLRENDEVDVVVWKRKKFDLTPVLGLMKGAKPFEREHPSQ